MEFKRIEFNEKEDIKRSPELENLLNQMQDGTAKMMSDIRISVQEELTQTQSITALTPLKDRNGKPANSIKVDIIALRKKIEQI